MNWASSTRVLHIADVMIRDRWKAIKSNFHFYNNKNMPPMNENNRDRLFKIRPLLDFLLPKVKQIPQQQTLCVDEQIVSFKGHSALKQYLPQKPHKWSNKIFMLCDTRGIVHNFEIYSGKILPVNGFPDLGASSNIVLKMLQVIRSHVNHVLRFDNWFTSVNLLVEQAKQGIFVMATARRNRLPGCSLKTEKELKRKGMEVVKKRKHFF